MIAYEAPLIRFTVDGTQLAQAPLSSLQRFIVVDCFDPEPGAPEPVIFDLLDFGDTFWLVPDAAAESFLSQQWAAHLQTCNGFFEAQAGALPYSWRRSYLVMLKHLYFPRAAVVAAQPTPFLQITGPLDPAQIGERNRQRYEAIMNHHLIPKE